MERFFGKFPSIEYNNKEVVNIGRRVVIANDIAKLPTVFYPYELQNNMRADQLAQHYYKDGHYDYLLYLTNGIIDPYYGWYLNNSDFEKFIVKKYGSYEDAVNKPKFYRLNWANTSGGLMDEIPPAFYENNLAKTLKKYYVPNYGMNGKLISYKKREEDWTVNTNMLVRIGVGTAEMFSKDEFVYIKKDGVILGNCTVVSLASTSELFVQHCEGDFFDFDTEIQNTSYLVNKDGNGTYIHSKTLVHRNIPIDEFVYWSKVSLYDYENEKNEANKHIYLLDSAYALRASEKIRLALKE